jgi:hypothetical protein
MHTLFRFGTEDFIGGGGIHLLWDSDSQAGEGGGGKICLVMALALDY